jgi:gluconolactonase
MTAMPLPTYTILPTPPLTELATGLRFPEGPVVMPDGSIALVEIEAKRLTRVSLDGRKSIIAEMTGGPNGAALGADGKLYVTNNGGFDWRETAHGLYPIGQASDYSGGRIERVDPASGQIETLYTACDGRGLRGPNDLVLDASGDIYFTDLGKTRAHDMDRCGVYYARRDGSHIVQVAGPTLTANGCSLSPDGKILYFVETESARLWAVDLDAPGKARRAPFPSPNGARFLAQVGGAYQRFDSMAVDAAGNICIATLLNGGITIVSPDGQTIRFLPLPDIMTTNICFGGPDMGTAYCTLSAKGRLVSFDWRAAVGTTGLKLNDGRA